MCLLSTHQLSKLNFTEFLLKMFMKFVFDAQYDQLGRYIRKGRKNLFQFWFNLAIELLGVIYRLAVL